MTPTLTQKLARVRALLNSHIEEAEKATPGSWSNSEDGLVNNETCIAICECEQLCHKEDAIFIASARTLSPLACKGLLLSIERFEKIACFHDGHVVDGSFDEPGSAQEAREALQEIESLFPDEN